MLLCCLCTCTNFFFFFQAEDGIRDDLVTGVQTCALPISITQPISNAVDLGAGALDTTLEIANKGARAVSHVYRTTSNIVDTGGGAGALRSEERRVGKEV